MTAEHGPTYEHSDDTAINIETAVLHYINTGEVHDGLPLDFRGLAVFAGIAVLRQNDEAFYGEATLDEETRARLAEIEADIDAAVAHNMQYYPFGHDKEFTDGDHAMPSGPGFRTSWAMAPNRDRRRSGIRSHPLPDTEFAEEFFTGRRIP